MAISSEQNKKNLLSSLDSDQNLKPSFKPFSRLVQAVGQIQNMDDGTQVSDSDKEVLKKIAVLAFVGPSGTGKSTRALELAKKYNIKYLIDDGLLISSSRIIAGSSAKKAKTKFDSVRQALFADDFKAENMRRALIRHKPASLMILGTSDSMVKKICQRLLLPEVSKYIRIEDVSTVEEIHMAKHIRRTEGHHTIPVPSMEVKYDFNAYFSDPLSLLRKRRDGDDKVNPLLSKEKTVVRPTFSTLGAYSISDEAILSMSKLVINEIEAVASLVYFNFKKVGAGLILEVGLALYYGFKAGEVLREVQQKLSYKIEEYTSINVLFVNVQAVRVVMDKTLIKAENSGRKVFTGENDVM